MTNEAPPPPPEQPIPDDPQSRRGFFSVLCVLIGGFVSLFPLVVGAFAFLDPLRRRRKETPEAWKGKVKSQDSAGFIDVASADAVTGTPQLFKVVAERHDAWNYFPNEPIGAVFLRKADDQIVAFNVTCPHAGCAVDFVSGKGAFYCPCHDSAFSLNGERSEDSPSARDLDELDVKLKDGQVWVKYQNFRSGTAEKVVEE